MTVKITFHMVLHTECYTDLTDFNLKKDLIITDHKPIHLISVLLTFPQIFCFCLVFPSKKTSSLNPISLSMAAALGKNKPSSSG